MLAMGELETSYEGEAVKFADSIELARRIRILRTEIAKLKAEFAGISFRRTRGIRTVIRGDN